MSDIDIQRDHSLGLQAARELAWSWAEDAEMRLGMSCTYEEGDDEDVVYFERSGVNGELRVTAAAFSLKARLGFLLAAFKPRIEQEVQSNLDKLLGAAAGRAAQPASGGPGPGKARARAAKAAPARKPGTRPRKT